MLQPRRAHQVEQSRHRLHIPMVMLAAAIDRFADPRSYPHGVAPLPNEQRGITFAAYGGISGVREFQRFNRAVEAAKREVSIAESLPLSDVDKVREQHLEARTPGNIMLRNLQV